MDYIPQLHALQTSREAIVVPLLSHTRYEESIPFEKYPEYQGWGIKWALAGWGSTMRAAADALELTVIPLPRS